MVVLFIYTKLCLLCLSIFIITENHGNYKINTNTPRLNDLKSSTYNHDYGIF